MEKLDMLGQPCPIPVVQSKRLLARDDVDAVEVAVDNIVAVQNLEKMANGLQYGFSYVQSGDKVFLVQLAKGDAPPPPQAQAASLDEPVRQPMVRTAGEGPTILITSDQMGTGAEELGRILIKGYIFSLTELSPPPKTLLFLNGGAKLTTQGANTVADLKTLEENGAEILTCGTCVNFFGLQDKLAVGAITDMMGISARIAAATQLITL